MADKSKKILLIETLQPLWKMTQYTGLLLNWVGNPDSSGETNTWPCSSVLSTIPRILIIFLVVSSFVLMTMFEILEIVWKVMGWADFLASMIANLVMNVILLLPLPQACFNILHLVFNNRKVVKLIKQFHVLESRLLVVLTNNNNKRLDRVIKRRRSSYSLIIVTNLVPFICIAYMYFQAPDFSVFLTSNETLCSIFPIPLLQAFQIAVSFLVILYQIITDLVPSFAYYHAGAAMLTIQDEINNMHKASARQQDGTDRGQQQHHLYLQIWLKYNHLRRIVKKVDCLFGWMTFLDYGIKFFMISLISYSILHNFRYSSSTDVVIIFVTMMCYLFRLLCCISLKSELCQSREKLTSLMASHITANWLDMCAEERQVFSAFQSQVNGDQLAANPKGLFVVNPGIVLTMLGLIVSYLVVLLQSN